MTKFEIEFSTTGRGFAVGEFVDLYGSKCSLQKSSIATQDCVWLGVDFHFDGKPSSRMHLTRAQAAALVTALKMFVETGELPDPGIAAIGSVPDTNQDSEI